MGSKKNKTKQPSLSTILGLSILAFALFISMGLNASAGSGKGESPGDDTEVRLSVGVKSMFHIGWSFIPFPATGVLSVDFADWFRARAELTHHFLENVTRPSAGFGAAIPLVGASANRMGGFQMKIPIMFDLGFAHGDVEGSDGYSEKVRAVLLGPGTGIDFTWWGDSKLGFCLSIAINYMFRINLPSAHNTDMALNPNTHQVFEAAILVGVAF